MSDARWSDPREYGERDRGDEGPRVYDPRDRDEYDPRDGLMRDLDLLRGASMGATLPLLMSSGRRTRPVWKMAGHHLRCQYRRRRARCSWL